MNTIKYMTEIQELKEQVQNQKVAIGKLKESIKSKDEKEVEL